jgi:hypothetical protein
MWRTRTRRRSSRSALERFAKLLGLANALTAYEYVRAGETTGLRRVREFEEVPEDEAVAELVAKLDRRKANAAARKRLRTSSVLLYEEKRKGVAFPRACASRGGFVVSWGGRWDVPEPLRWVGPPWGEAREVPLALSAGKVGLSASAGGERLAVLHSGGIAVIRATNWAVEGSFPAPKPDHGDPHAQFGVVLSAGVDAVSREGEAGLTLERLSDGRRVASVPQPSTRFAMLHPSGRWAVAAHRGLWVVEASAGVASMPPRQLFLGGRDRDQERSLSKLPGGPTGPIGAEPVFPLAFSRDGERLWVGSDRGLRGYEWRDVVDAAGGRREDLPPPRWRFNNDEMGGPMNALRHGYVYAGVEEPGGAGVVFGGLNGAVYRLDLSTNETRVLIELPDRPRVLGLAITADATALATCGLADSDSSGRARASGHLRVWAYPKLLAMAEG